MKKINGISLLHGIAILSGIGIVGIFAWCDESINEGGRGITPTLLFVVYVLLLLACNAEIIASDENFKRVFYLKNTYKGALSIPSYVFFLSKTRLVENMI